MNTSTAVPVNFIPLEARIFGWLLCAAGCFFAYVYTFNPGAFFPGISISSISEQFGLYSTAVRILGSVLGIVLALLSGSPAMLALMLATRIFIELGDVAVGLTINNGSPDTNTVTLVVLAGIEAIVLVRLIRHIRARN